MDGYVRSAGRPNNIRSARRPNNIRSACRPNTRAGFTLVEILLALVLFALTVGALVQSNANSRRNVVISERLFQAVQLGQAKMAELESKFQKTIDSQSVESSFTKQEGTFDAPNDGYKWKAELRKNKLAIGPADISKFMTGLGLDSEEVEQQMAGTALLLSNMNKILKQNFAELSLEIEWDEFGRKAKLPLITHIIPKKPKIEFSATIDNTTDKDAESGQ